MPDIKKRTIKACAFDLGNTLINDTQLSKAATIDMGQWLFNKSLIQSRESFIDTFESVNHSTDKPFISHTFGELEFFEKTFEKFQFAEGVAYKWFVGRMIDALKSGDKGFPGLNQRFIKKPLAHIDSGGFCKLGIIYKGVAQIKRAGLYRSFSYVGHGSSFLIV